MFPLRLDRRCTKIPLYHKCGSRWQGLKLFVPPLKSALAWTGLSLEHPSTSVLVKMKGLLWRFVILQCLVANASDFRSTCQHGEAKEGERGQIVYFIREDINMDTDMHLLLTIRNDNISGDIVNCHWKDTLSKLRCDVIDHRFNTDLIGHNLSLVLTSVTLDLAGQYVMNIIVNSSSDQATSCDFHVQESNDAQVGNTTTIVAASVTVVLLLLAVIALLIFLWIRNKRRHASREGTKDEMRDLNESGNTTIGANKTTNNIEQRISQRALWTRCTLPCCRTSITKPEPEAIEGPRRQQGNSNNDISGVCVDSYQQPGEIIKQINANNKK
ncbi:uncharacterized protein [Littorina saxatilis]|uniref:uncharacterized protein isoform X3 n=1 Tax=Littorina saxatilis TaxID=31220 RepID=UPI0038B59E1C